MKDMGRPQNQDAGNAKNAIERVVLRNIVKTYGSTVALRGVSAEFRARSVSLVEGANGSGKSTLLGIVGTMIKPSSGRVLYEPLGEDAHAVRAALGWVSHETLAYPDLTGRQNIELSARIHGLKARETWEASRERFELGSFAERPLRTCSRGQKQRIALARALVHGPSLLLLDEPTTGLDKAGVSRLLDVLDEEVERGAAVLVVSHEPEVFGSRPKMKLVLERGRVLEPSRGEHP